MHIMKLVNEWEHIKKVKWKDVYAWSILLICSNLVGNLFFRGVLKSDKNNVMVEEKKNQQGAIVLCWILFDL